jgi:hypothetical protein
MRAMTTERLATDIYKEFKAKPEAQRIATEFALIELAKLVSEIKPKNVLEIGAGIGTITALLLQHPNRPSQITVTEANPVCLLELEKNLKGLALEGYKLIKSADDLKPHDVFDLVIFDGILDEDKQYRVFKLGSWCFVEGSRTKTIIGLKKKLESFGLTINMQTKRPGGQKLKWKSARTILGVPLPAFKFRPVKGCSSGQVTSLVKST